MGKTVSISNKLTLTSFDINTIDAVLSSPSQPGSGCGIKDIRLLQGITKVLKSKIPVKPVMPKNPTANAEQEVKEQYVKDLEKYQDELQLWLDIEVDFELSPIQITIIQSKLASYTNFSDNEVIRDRLVKLADKFGV